MSVEGVLGDRCWCPLAIGVSAGVGMGGEVQMVAWGDVSACGMHCGAGCDGG